VFQDYATYTELLAFATSCANSARLTISPRMAMEYQEEAAKLNGGKLPEIGDPPIVVGA
jgi:hypothetical protein